MDSSTNGGRCGAALRAAILYPLAKIAKDAKQEDNHRGTIQTLNTEPGTSLTQPDNQQLNNRQLAYGGRAHFMWARLSLLL